MSYTISANLTVFGNIIDIAPNSEVPTRVESSTGFCISSDQMNDFTANFPAPAGLTIPDVPEGGKLNINQVVVDVKTGEFQLGLSVDFDETFFLNQFPDILAINTIDAFISCNVGSSNPDS